MKSQEEQLVWILGKLKIPGIVFASLLIFLAIFGNPFGVARAGENYVIESKTGKIFVHPSNKPGWYFKGFFHPKVTPYPEVITLVWTASELKEDVTYKGGPLNIRFNDATQAIAEATVRWRMPTADENIIAIHREFHSSDKLAESMLSRYSAECLRFAAQTMESETHYSGGMSQLSSDFQDQLENGQFLLRAKVKDAKDTTGLATERIYVQEKVLDENGEPVRRRSNVQQFNITVAIASIDNVDYEPQVDEKLAAKIEASTNESISKQQLVTARQEALTAEEKGKKELVSIRYEKLKEQERQVIAKQTEAEVAKADVAKQRADLEAAKLEAQATRVRADAEAYKKRQVIQADGALEQKLDAFVEIHTAWADAFSKYEGRLVPNQVIGGSGNSNSMGTALSLQELMSIQLANQLNLDTKSK